MWCFTLGLLLCASVPLRETSCVKDLSLSLLCFFVANFLSVQSADSIGVLARFQPPGTFGEPKPAGNVPVDKGFEDLRHRLADEHRSVCNRCLCKLQVSHGALVLSLCSCPNHLL